MTREERDNAITILENEKKCVNRANKNDYCNRDCYNCELVKTDTEILTALDMAIKALEQSMPTMVYPQVDGITPTVVAQADGEYISRQAVLDLLEDTNNGWIINEILQLPSVKPQDCDTCEVGNPCLYCKHEFEPQESEVRNG